MRYLFSGRGKGCSRGCGREFAEEDEYLKNNWTIVYDKYGNGCCIDFPLVIIPRLKYGPIVYDRCTDGSVTQKQRQFTETITVTLVKKRC